jgi:hypothetical protein
MLQMFKRKGSYSLEVEKNRYIADLYQYREFKRLMHPEDLHINEYGFPQMNLRRSPYLEFDWGDI